VARNHSIHGLSDRLLALLSRKHCANSLLRQASGLSFLSGETNDNNSIGLQSFAVVVALAVHFFVVLFSGSRIITVKAAAVEDDCRQPAGRINAHEEVIVLS
jgi:hypothetical protein